MPDGSPPVLPSYVPALVTSQAREQVAVGAAPFHTAYLPDGEPWVEIYRLREDYLLRFPRLADFRVSSCGRDVECWPVPGIPAGTIDHIFLNQVYPLMLSRQRELVFHASAVVVDTGAVAFMAEAGRGKSTLATSFAVNGHPFLTDDGLWLRRNGKDYDVMPSHPSVRLWRDSEHQLIPEGSAAAPSVHYTPKGRFVAGPAIAYCDTPRPLRAAFILGPGIAETVTIAPIKPADALVTWIAHSFVIDIEDKSLTKGSFEGLTSILNTVPTFSLDYPRRYEHLDRVRAAIIEKTGSLKAEQ